MLSKQNRTNKKLVNVVFKEGRFVNSPNLMLKFIKKDVLAPKISFVAPKTVSKRAVDRNLLRRRGYFLIKKELSRFPVGFVGIFVFGKKSKEIFGGRKNKTNNPILNLEKEIKIILEKLKI